MKFLTNDWWELLEDEFREPYYISLRERLIEEYRERTIYPDMYHIYQALNLTSFAETKVVILGQDPYHEPGQANGLAFSVYEGTPLPPSLRNIFKELEDDLGIRASSGDLTPWAKEGVLLLNATLTVRRGEANSHQYLGWERFTDSIIRRLNERPTPTVFILWGANAKKKKTFLTNPVHCMIESAHPSPLSAHRGFFGSKPFSKANEFLTDRGIRPIRWEL